jgi:hypothetical protein
MKNFYVTFFSLFLLSQTILGQDLIIKKDYSVVKSNVLKVKEDVVEYKKFDNPDGPIYEINKREIIKIVYKNNTEDVFVVAERNDSLNNSGNKEALGDRQENVPAVQPETEPDVPIDTRPDCEKRAYGTLQVRNISQYSYDLFVDNVFVVRLEPKIISGKIPVSEGNSRSLSVSQVNGYLLTPTVRTSSLNVIRCSPYSWQIP